MRIISKFQDYYDSIQKMTNYVHSGPTSDVKSVTSDVRPWIREKKRIKLEKLNSRDYFPFPRISNDHTGPDFWSSWKSDRSSRGFSIIFETVGFCGKIYCPAIISWPSPESIRNGFSVYDNKEYCYSVEDIDKAVEKMIKDKAISKKEHKEYYDLDRKKNKKRISMYGKVYSELNFWDKDQYPLRIYSPDFNQECFKKAFEAMDKHGEKFDEWFQKEKSPIFRVVVEDRTRYLEYDSCLSDVKFYRIFDANAAFQEIDMYRSNMCFPEPHINEVPDVISAESHGFNKFSFRKDPSKKKK